MQRKDKVIIEKIIREIDFAAKRIADMTESDFIADEDAQHSIGMAAINVGELVKHISDETRSEHPNIPWKSAAGLRDVAAHSYDTIRMEDLFQTIEQDFPALRQLLYELL